MRGLIRFFASLAIGALIAASLQVAMRIYNYAGASKIDTVLLQPAPLYQNRIQGAVIPLANMSDDYVRGQLIKKFATEYLSVVPNSREPAARAGPRGLLRMMSHPEALAVWKRDVLPELEKMADDKKMRTIEIHLRDIRVKDAYYVVPFKTKTWHVANDLDAPATTDGGRELYLRLRFIKKVKEFTRQGEPFDAGGFLDDGMPAPAIFSFIVDEVRIQ